MRSFKSCISKVILVFCMALMFGICGYSNVQAQGDDQYTKLLMHMDDSNFKDECGHIVDNPINRVTLKDSKDNFNKSAYFNNKSSFQVLNSNGDFDFGNGEYTIDFWAYFNSIESTYTGLIDYRQTTTTIAAPTIYLAKNKINILYNNDNKITGTTELQANKWYHISLVKSNGVTKLYLNGVQEGSSWIDTNTYGTVSYIHIGHSYDNFNLNGYIDELRISKGIARWIANFDSPTKPYSCITRIALNKISTNLTEGQTDTLISKIEPDNATTKTIKWTSNNTSIATVDDKGIVTAKSEGTAIITATAIDGSNLSALCTVNVSKVPVMATGITLNKSTDSLTIDESHQLIATIAPADATTNSIIWTSSDSSTVSVDEITGQIKGTKVGTAIITATIKDTNISTTCVVTVKPKDTIPIQPTDNTGNAILTITMTNGNVKSYTVSMSKVNDFKNWYDNRVSGSTGKAYYEFDKTDNTQTTFSKKTEYIVFDKISSFEIDEYSK